MPIPFWSLLAVIFIPYVLAFVASGYKKRQFGSVDNHQPRAQSVALEGAGARAWAAQQNAWEALVVFAIAVFVAHLAGASPVGSAWASLIFVGARILHAVFYVRDQASLRSAVFGLGTLSCLALFVLAALA